MSKGNKTGNCQGVRRLKSMRGGPFTECVVQTKEKYLNGKKKGKENGSKRRRQRETKNKSGIRGKKKGVGKVESLG